MMKNNFGNTLSKKEQLAVARWWTISILLLTITISTIAFFSLPVALATYKLKKEHAELQKKLAAMHPTEEQINLQKKEELLARQQKKITAYTQRAQSLTNSYRDILESIRTHAGALESVIIDTKKFELIARYPSEQHAFLCVETIGKSPELHTTTLTDIQTQKALQGTAIKATIQGVRTSQEPKKLNKLY